MAAKIGRHILMFYFWSCIPFLLTQDSAPVGEQRDVTYSKTVDAGKTNKKVEEDYLMQLAWP